MDLTDMSEIVNVAGKARYDSKRQLIVYTAAIGDYDGLPTVHCQQSEGVELVCITDRLTDDPGPWKLIVVDREPISALVQAKIYKMSPHIIFPNVCTSIWIDGTFEIIGDMQKLAKVALSKNRAMVTFSHPVRRCAYAEARACWRLEKESYEVISRQVEHYRRIGFPKNEGLLHGGVLVRKHMHEDVINVMERWWREVSTFSMRDQISFNFVLWTYGLRWKFLDDSIHCNPYVRWTAHRNPQSPPTPSLAYAFWKCVYRGEAFLKRGLASCRRKLARSK